MSRGCFESLSVLRIIKEKEILKNKKNKKNKKIKTKNNKLNGLLFP